MALPIVLPAIAEGAAALSAALGLTAIATKNDQNFGNINLNGIRTAAGLNIAPLVISTGTLFNKANSPVKVNVPSADNALVLRPEYRTETLVNPLEFIGYKPAWSESDHSNDSTNTVVEEGNQQTQMPSSQKPEDDKPKNNQQSNNSNKNSKEDPKQLGFKSGLKSGWGWTKKGLSYAGQGLGWGIGFGVPTVGIPSGIYFGGKALGWWGNDDKKEPVIEVIE